MFFLQSTYPLECKLLKFGIFPGSFTILGDYVYFLGINPHNSNSNNRCMKRCTRTFWKTMLVVFSKFSCLLQRMGRDFKDTCGKSQPQMRRLLGYQLYIEQWNMCLENMTAGMVPWYGLTVPWLKAEKVWFMSSCTPFINRTITKEVPCFWEGNHQDWRGI